MRCSLVSVCLLTCSASALHLPFTRSIPTPAYSIVSERANVLAHSGSLKLDNFMNGLYTSVITIDGKDVPVNLDTGSTDFYLYNYVDGLLDNARTHPSLDLTLTYGRGGVSGNVSQIDVSFAGFNVANQSFLYVTKTNQTAIVESRLAAGLLGLGFDTTSSINSLVQLKFPGETWGRSLLTNIFLSDLSTPNHIAFRLNRLYDNNDTDTGSFDIGTFAPGFEAVNNTAEIPIFTTSPDRNRYWTVLVDGVAVNGKNQTLKTTITNGAIPPNGKLAAVLDTGYSYSQVTPEMAAAIYEPIGGIFNTTYSLYVVPCEAQANVTFYIGGQAVPIHPLDLNGVSTMPINGQDMTICFGPFQPFSSNTGGGIVDLILGDSFLRNTYTVYDFGDFVNGTSGAPHQNPYIKLLPLTDPEAASAEFRSARKAYLANFPPQLNITTLNSSNPQAISGTGASVNGSNGTPRTGLSVGVVGLVAGAIGVRCLL